jgi:CheY-like chemotaxis protein
MPFAPKRYVAAMISIICGISDGSGRFTPSHFVPQGRDLPQVSGEGRHVALVVDDDPDLRANFRELLEELGQDVEEAANGQEAFNFLVFNPTTKVDLILLDLQMPVMDGWQFLTLVKSYIRLSKIPVVVASSFASTLDPVWKREVAACLQTPSDLVRLPAVVRRLCGT